MEGKSILKIGEFKISPKSPFWAGSAQDTIKGTIHGSAFIETIQNNVKLDVYPPQCDREYELRSIARLFAGKPVSVDKEMIIYESPSESIGQLKSRENHTLPIRGQEYRYVDHQKLNEVQCDEKFVPAYGDLWENVDCCTERRELEPFHNYSLIVKSLHGDIELRVHDKHCGVVASALNMYVKKHLKNQISRRISRKIYAETSHGDAIIFYEK